MNNLPGKPEFHPPVAPPTAPAELITSHDPLEDAATIGGSTALSDVFLIALRRWGLWTVPLGLILATAGAGFLWWIHKPVYEATALFRVNSEMFLGREAERIDPQVHGQFVQTQLELIRSPVVLDQILGDIQQIPIVEEQEFQPEWLKHIVRVNSLGQSEFLQISCRCPGETDKGEKAAKEILKAITDQYLEVYRSHSADRHKEQMTLVGDAINDQMLVVKDLREKVRKLHKQVYGKDPYLFEAKQERSPRYQENRADALHRRVTESEVDKDLVEMKLRAITSQLITPDKKLEDKFNDLVARDEVVQRLESELQERTKKLDELKKSNTSKAVSAATDVSESNAAKPTQQNAGRLQFEKMMFAELLRERRDHVRDELIWAACREVLVNRSPKTPQELVQQKLEADPGMAQFAEAIAAKQARVDEYAGLLNTGETVTELNRRTTELKELEKKRDDYQARLVRHFTAVTDAELQRQHIDKFDELVADVRRARAEHAVVREKLADTTAELTVDVEAGREETVELEFARQSLDRAMDMHQLLDQQLMNLKTQEQSPDRVVPLDSTEPVKVSAKPVNGSPYRNMALLALLGLVAPTGLATLWELRVKRISSADQFARELSIPVLGEITRLPGLERMAFRSVGAEQSRAAMLYEQSTLVLSDNISHSHQLKNVKVMAVSSAVKGEGKSHLAVKLAANLARVMPGKVLLIDGDIRFRSVERLLGITGHVGLVEALHKKVDIADAIQELPGGLHVVTAGLPGHRSYDLLRNGVMPGIFEQLRRQYKYIIIDTPPILSAGESLSFGKVSDGTLICALRDVSRIPQTRKAIARLLSVGVRPLGAILAGVPLSAYEATYNAYVPAVEQQTEQLAESEAS